MNGKASKDKGSRAEREVAALLHDATGAVMRRTLAGHANDCGDLHGLKDTTIEVKNLATLTTAINEGIRELVKEQANAGTPFGVCFVRRRGGDYIACMTPDQFIALWREATA